MSERYPSGDPYPITRRLHEDAVGMEVHVSNYRKDAADALWAIAQRDAEIDRLRGEITEAYRRGQEDMRERLASWLMCGCDIEDRTRVVAAATTGGPNSGARWRACHRADCGALIAAEALEMPIKEAE